MLPVIVCMSCGKRASLPIRRFKDSELIEHYWPHESETLAWVCDSCSHLTMVHHVDVLQLPDELVEPARADRGFWRVEISCSEPVCPFNITAHTQTFGQTTRDAIGRRVALAHPPPLCPSDFLPSSDVSPVTLDFIEWTGGEDYLA